MLHHDRLKAVLKNMALCGLRQVIISDPGAMQYLLGQSVDAMERCGILLLLELNTEHETVQGDKA